MPYSKLYIILYPAPLCLLVLSSTYIIFCGTCAPTTAIAIKVITLIFFDCLFPLFPLLVETFYFELLRLLLQTLTHSAIAPKVSLPQVGLFVTLLLHLVPPRATLHMPFTSCFLFIYLLFVSFLCYLKLHLFGYLDQYSAHRSR